MSKTLLIGAVIAGVCLLGGCQAWVSPPDVVVNDASGAEGSIKSNRDYRAPIILESFRFPDQTGAGVTAYKAALADTTGATRNRLLDALMTQSDANCKIYKDSLYVRVAARKQLLEFTALASAASAAIVGGGLATQILAGVATGATGTNAIADAEALQNQLVPIINATISTARTSARTELYTKQMNGTEPTPLSAYSVDRGIQEVVATYDYACSLNSALDTLSKTAALPKGASATTLAAERLAVTTQLEAAKAVMDTIQGKITAMGAAPDPDALKQQKDLLAGTFQQAQQLQRRLTQIDTLLIIANQQNISQ